MVGRMRSIEIMKLRRRQLDCTVVVMQRFGDLGEVGGPGK